MPVTVASSEKGAVEIEGEVDQPQLVLASGASRRSRRRGRDAGPQEIEHDERRADIEHDLDEIAPDHRAQPADEGEDQAEDDQGDRGGQHVRRLDVGEDDHRDGDRGEVEPGAAREDPADQIHAAGRAHRPRVEAVAEQLVDRRHPLGVETGDEEFRDQEGGDERPEIGGEIGIVAAIAVIGRAEEGRRRLGGREHRHRHQPDRDPVPGEEIIGGVALPPGREDAGEREQCDIGPDDRPNRAA